MALEFILSVKTFHTLAHTRSTTRSDKSCWHGEWVSDASSRKPARANMEWRQQLSAHFLGWIVLCTWARKTCADRRSTFFGWSCWAPKCAKSTAGSRTLKDAINEAMRDWVTNVADTYYLLGSALGPHPYPTMVRDFQSIIGRETREQILEKEGRLPNVLIACVGGGSNSIGLFHPFLTTRRCE